MNASSRVSKITAVNSAVLSSGAACRAASTSVSLLQARAVKGFSGKSSLFLYSNRLTDGLCQDEVGLIEIEAWRFSCLPSHGLADK